MAKYSGIDNINKSAFDAILPRVKEGIENGTIKCGTAPVFDATIEFKDGKEVISMNTKDREFIFNTIPAVFGIRLPDEEDPTLHQVVYLQLAIGMKETADAVVYQVLIPDEDEGTIEQKAISFFTDGDNIKAALGSEKFFALPVPENGDEGKVPTVNGNEDGYVLTLPSGGTKLYKHTISSWTGSMLTENNPLVIVSTSNTPYTMYTLSQMVMGVTPDFTIINIFDGTTGVKAVALTIGNYMPNGFTRLSLYYQYVNNGTLTADSKVIAEDAMDLVTGFTDTVVAL